MSKLAGVTARMKMARFAQEQFLIFWAMEDAVVRPALDRVAADLESKELLYVAFDASTSLDALGPIADE